MNALLPLLILAAGLAACGSGEAAPGASPTQAFNGIGEEEVIFLTGTEPFWGGEIEGDAARYTTPENQGGAQFAVQRFAGNNGLAFTGSMDGENFDLTVTPGDCSDGMSDRTYPFVATLKLGDEQRNGCAWTDRTPFAGPTSP